MRSMEQIDVILELNNIKMKRKTKKKFHRRVKIEINLWRAMVEWIFAAAMEIIVRVVHCVVYSYVGLLLCFMSMRSTS